MLNQYSYTFKGEKHTDTSAEYFASLNMSDEQIESVLAQEKFELNQNKNKRKLAYNSESDPLYMEWQFDQTAESEETWRNKVAEIKARYPLAN
jgi:hypothetical protein